MNFFGGEIFEVGKKCIPILEKNILILIYEHYKEKHFKDTILKVVYHLYPVQISKGITGGFREKKIDDVMSKIKMMGVGELMLYQSIFSTACLLSFCLSITVLPPIYASTDCHDSSQVNVE